MHTESRVPFSLSPRQKFSWRECATKISI